MNRKVALITGSVKDRVGRRVALALARRGHDVALHYNTSASDVPEALALMRAEGAQAEAYAADLADEAAVHRMVDAVAARFGRIDVLVNAAAIWERKALEEVTAADVRRHFEANALGTFLTCQRVGLIMTRQPEGGCVVNIGDWAEARPYADYAAYFPSKGAVSALTRSFAVELARRNPRVRVNGVLPGPVMLPADLPEVDRRRSIDATLVKHEGSPENVAQAVLALVENEFITGALLPVDGGRTLWGP